MHRELKRTFCKCVEIETTAFRTQQLIAAHLLISKGNKVEDTNLLNMIHLECMDMALAIPESHIPDDVALAAFSFCRWFLYDSSKPDWIIEMENLKSSSNKDIFRTYIFSRLHLLNMILEAGQLNDTVYVDHNYFTSEDNSIKQFTFSILLCDSASTVFLINKYQQDWPDAILVGIGSSCCAHREEVKNDDKNNMIIEEIGKEHGFLVKELINKNSKVFG